MFEETPVQLPQNKQKYFSKNKQVFNFYHIQRENKTTWKSQRIICRGEVSRTDHISTNIKKQRSYKIINFTFTKISISKNHSMLFI